MFYPGGGYPGFYFWLFGATVPPDIFEFEVGVCLLVERDTITMRQLDASVGVVTSLTLNVEVER